MIDPIQSTNGFSCPLTGASFTDADQCRQHTQAVTSRRNAYAGRELRPEELLTAPSKADTRSPAERSAWRIAHPLVTTPQERPATDKLAEMSDPRFYGGQQRETVQQFRERTVREMKAKLEAKPTIDPVRERAKAAAVEALELASFRPDLPVSFTDLGKLLVECAQRGTLDDFAKYHAEFVDGLDAIEAQKQAQITLQIAQLQAAKVNRFSIEEPKEEPKPEPVKPKSDAPEHFSQVAIDLASPEEAERMKASNMAFWHWRSTR